MTRPQLSELHTRLANADPRDRDQLLEILGLLRDIRDFVRLKNVPDVTSCLDASVSLLEVVVAPGDRFDRTTIRDYACSILATVRDAVKAARESKGAEAPAAEPGTEPTDGADATRAPSGESGPASTGPDEAPVETKLRTMDEVEESHMDALAALSEEDAARVAGASDGRLLGQLLIELGHVSETEVADALSMHRKTGIATGECLLLNGATSPDKLLATLRLQEQLRAQAEGDDGATAATGGGAAELGTTPAALPSTASASAPAAKAALRMTQDMFIGEVLLGSEVITNDQLEEAMHIHHHEGLKVGQALLRIGALTQEQLDAGLELQKTLQNIAGLSRNFEKKA